VLKQMVPVNVLINSIGTQPHKLFFLIQGVQHTHNKTNRKSKHFCWSQACLSQLILISLQKHKVK